MFVHQTVIRSAHGRIPPVHTLQYICGTTLERLTEVVIETLRWCFVEASLGCIVEKYGKDSFASKKKNPGAEWERNNSEEFSKSSLAHLVPFSDEIHQGLQYPIFIWELGLKC